MKQMSIALKILRGFILSLAILSVIIVAKLIFILDINDTDSATSLSNIVMAIASTINLIFIIAFYIFDKKIKKNDETNTYKLYWYKTYCLEKCHEHIKEYFDLCESAVKDAINKRDNPNPDILRSIFALLNTGLYELKNSTVHILIVLNDKNGKEILKFIEDDLETDVQKELSLLIVNTDTQPSSINQKLLEYKEEFYKKLYIFGQNLYCK